MKKQVATWVVTGMLAVGGVAFAQDEPAPDDRSTTDALDATTTTTEAEPTTTTTEAPATTTTTEAGDDVEGDIEGDGEAHGNSVAAHHHDHPNCANHGEYVSMAAKLRKTGETVPTDCPAADAAPVTETGSTTTTEVQTDEVDAPAPVKGNGKGKGKGGNR